MFAASLTSAIATLLGAICGWMPDVFKEIRDSRNHTRELAHMDKVAEIQMRTAQATADARMREAEAGLLMEEFKSWKEQSLAIIEAQAKPTGIVWIDAFNALLRPACTAMMLVLFFVMSGAYAWSLLVQFASNQITAEQMQTLLWAGPIGDMMAGVMGFLYGYRSTVKK